MRRRISTAVLAATLLLGAGAGTASALSAQHSNGGQVAVKAWTENGARTVKLQDTLNDGRWVQTKWLQQGQGKREFTLPNKSGSGTTVSYSTSGKVTSIIACFSGAGLAPMQCNKSL